MVCCTVGLNFDLSSNRFHKSILTLNELNKTLKILPGSSLVFISWRLCCEESSATIKRSKRYEYSIHRRY